MTPFTVEIEDSSLDWQDVTAQVESFSDGTTSDAQIIPSVSISFFRDAEGTMQALIDPEVNPSRYRLRITEGDLVTYFIIRELTGDVQRAMDGPSISGYAAAAVVNDWPPLTHSWNEDALASTIASQVCVRKPSDMSGASVGVIWSAAINPTIPGGRYSVQKKARKDILKDLAEACGASVRVTIDGLNFEIYDRPARDLSGTAARTFDNPLTLDYRSEKVDKPCNAVRVKGEAVESGKAKLPVIKVQVIPGAIDADGSSTAEAYATVYDGSGRPVRHKQVVEDSIDAGSYTSIQVSGCWGGPGDGNMPVVWLNTGTQSAPVKGARVTPSGFTASTITVPDNGNQLFIVSYTQAQVVSWGLSDYADQVNGEAQSTTGALAVSTTEYIGRVRGVYRASDVNRTGTNFFTGGSATENTKSITLGISPGAAGSAVIIDYDVYNGTPLSASLSPSSSLCDADGIATTTIGAGSVVGLAVISASALGQSGDGFLSLLGAAVASLKLKASPATLQSATPVSLNQEVIDEVVSVANIVENGVPYSVIDVDNKVLSVSNITLNIVGVVAYTRWANDDDSGTYRIYLNGTFVTGLAGTVDYQAPADTGTDNQTSTITATALQDDGSPVTDGTPVEFKIVGRSGGSTLSSEKAYTADGEATVQLAAGDPAEFTVQAVCGPFVARVEIVVSDSPEGQEDVETDGKNVSVVYPSDPEDGNAEDKANEPDSYNAVTGYASGKRRLIGCDGPLAFAQFGVVGPTSFNGTTDSDGWMYFTAIPPGSYEITCIGITRPFVVSPKGG